MKSTMAVIARIVGEVAQLDKRGKLAVYSYLEGELAKPVVERSANTAATGEISTVTGAKVPVTYREGTE